VMWAEQARACGDEHDRASTYRPSNRRSPPASHDCAVQSPAPRPAQKRV